MSKNKGNRKLSIKEVSKKMNIPVGTIRQWEKDLSGILSIPRGENNARFFTDKEIEILKKIKEMRKNNVSKEQIRDHLAKELNGIAPGTNPSLTTEVAIRTEEIPGTSIVEKKPVNEITTMKTQTNIEEFFAALEQYKLDLIQDIKDAVTSSQAEVMDELKKEISSSSIHTIKQISKSIQRANEKRRGELEKVSNTVLRASEQTSKAFSSIADSLRADAKSNYERFSQQLTETTKNNAKENKNLYLKVNRTVNDAKDSINKANDSLEEKQQILLEKINEIKQNTEEIQQREIIFQEMLKSFREAAAAKPEKKKWWKIWS